MCADQPTLRVQWGYGQDGRRPVGSPPQSRTCLGLLPPRLQVSLIKHGNNCFSLDQSVLFVGLFFVWLNSPPAPFILVLCPLFCCCCSSLMCRCNNTALWVSCTATSLDLIPITLNPHITSLNLHNSQVSHCSAPTNKNIIDVIDPSFSCFFQII